MVENCVIHTLSTEIVNSRAWNSLVFYSFSRENHGVPLHECFLERTQRRKTSLMEPLTIIERGEYKYVEAGSGEPLVVLHGLFGALSNFADVFDHFSDRFRVIIPMLPIYELPMLSTSAKNLAKHIEGFVDELALEKVHLLGNSLGGHVGLIFTRDNLDRVCVLVAHGEQRVV